MSDVAFQPSTPGGRFLIMSHTRTCQKCQTPKELTRENFHLSRSRKEGFQYVCIPCNRIESYKADIRRHGISVEEFEEKARRGCAICGTTVCASGKRLAIDHDHQCCSGDFSCGRCIRGVLCISCNRGLGYFGDDPAQIRRAAEYLEAAKDVSCP